MPDLKTNRMVQENSQQQNQSRHISADLEDQIRLRAYQLYKDRGEVSGYEIEDWLQAEAEIRAPQKIQKAA